MSTTCTAKHMAAWTTECERSARGLEVLFQDPRDWAGRFVSPRSWLITDAGELQLVAGLVSHSVPYWDLMNCDFCRRPVGNGAVYVRVLGQGGHSGEAHLRCPWWKGIGVDPGAALEDWVRAAELGLWDVQDPWSFADRKEVHLLQLDAALKKGEVDVGLEDLLLALNSHPRVCTSCSCRGHGGEDGSIQMHTDDGGLSRRIKCALAEYRDEGAREWDRAYSEPGDWFVTVSVPAAEDDFRTFSARLLGVLGIGRRVVTRALPRRDAH